MAVAVVDTNVKNDAGAQAEPQPPAPGGSVLRGGGLDQNFSVAWVGGESSRVEYG